MPVSAVVEDFYHGHLTQGIQPMIFVLSGDNTSGTASICIRPGQEKECLEYLKKATMEVYNNEDFPYTWLKDEVLALYDDDRQVAIIYFVFAGIAIAVSCLGLFGISLFDIRQREQDEQIAGARRAQVGTGDRSERIRTYNYAQNRVTDHRIGFTLYKLDRVLDGDMGELLDALVRADLAQKMQNDK